MVKTAETFQSDLKEIGFFLKQKGKIQELASITNASERTVNNTFKVKSFDGLKGKKLTVYRKAIEMVAEIKSLPQKAQEVVEYKAP